jgi:hypothetical protein
LKPAQANSSQDLISKKPSQKRAGKVARVQALILQKKKKKKLANDKTPVNIR